jgi:hypothetical protein
MIQFDKDGVTLFYIDASGQRVAHGYTEGQAYADMLTIRSAQIQAAADNTQALANYNNVLANMQLNVNAGHGGDANVVAPAKPLQIVVADADGAVTHVPFVPPLADLVFPKTVPSTVQGLVNTSQPAPPDKQTIMYNMIAALFRKAFPDA